MRDFREIPFPGVLQKLRLIQGIANWPAEWHMATMSRNLVGAAAYGCAERD
jgi:hypothetical protein